MDDVKFDVLKRATAQWGVRTQMLKACEEFGECITQLSKRLNGSPTTDEAIIDEIADALIMALQMRNVFGSSLVDKRIKYKLDRITWRLSEPKAKP